MNVGKRKRQRDASSEGRGAEQLREAGTAKLENGGETRGSFLHLPPTKALFLHLEGHAPTHASDGERHLYTVSRELAACS